MTNDTDWSSFSDRLEDFLDNVHVWVGGDMQDINTAAFDPVFFAHHTMINQGLVLVAGQKRVLTISRPSSLICR